MVLSMTLIVLIFGIILIIAGWKKWVGNKTRSQWAMVLGVVIAASMIVTPGTFGLEPLAFAWPGAEDDEGDILDVTIAAGSWGNITEVVDTDKMGVTLQLNSNGAYSLDETAGSVNFTFAGIAPTGASADDLITVRFAYNDEAVYSGDEIYTETDDIPDVDWSVNGLAVEGGDGTFTMLYTDTPYAELRFTLDETGIDTFGDHMDTIGDKYTQSVVFTCGDWSETYTLTFLVITDA